MAKTKTRYVCQECGRSAPKALGRCPQCGAWDSMVEEIIVEDTKSALSQVLPGLGGFSTPKRLNEIDGDSEERIPVPIEEFSRVLGGGVVPGSIVLIGGDPGIGKSTLMLQMTMQMADGNTVLYVSGEESERQIKMRALRLLRGDQGQSGELPEDLYLVTETNLDMILQHVQAIRPRLLVVDSIQTVYRPDLESSAGSVSQVRESASKLRELAKTSGIAVFVIGHVTKQGVIAGPRVLEHIVDTVLYLEGDHFQAYRLLRSVKNRFGAPPKWASLKCTNAA